MTQEQQTTLLIRGAISQLPEDKQKKIKEIYQVFETLENEDKICLQLAIALKGAKLAE